MRTSFGSLALALALSLVPALGSAQDDAAASGATASVEETPRASIRQPSTVLTPSLLFTYGGGRTTDFGLGASLRLSHYPTTLPFRMGGWTTGEVQPDGTVRVAGGLFGGLWLFDCEVGLAYRSATAQSMGSLGLQLGKTIDFGWVSIGGRITIPLADFAEGNGAQLAQGIEGALVITIGIPATLDGPARNPLECPREAMRHMRDHCPCHDHHAADAGAEDDAPASDAPAADASTSATSG